MGRSYAGSVASRARRPSVSDAAPHSTAGTTGSMLERIELLTGAFGAPVYGSLEPSGFGPLIVNLDPMSAVLDAAGPRQLFRSNRCLIKTLS